MDGQNPAPLGIHEKPLFVGSYRGIILSGFARWCEMDFVHPHVSGASGRSRRGTSRRLAQGKSIEATRAAGASLEALKWGPHAKKPTFARSSSREV